MKNCGLETMFKGFREVKADEGFANIVGVALEAKSTRDDLLSELGDDAIDKAVVDNPDEEDIKNRALEDEEMASLIDSIPETDIDDAAIASGDVGNIDAEDVMGAPMEATLRMCEELIPDTEEV